MKYTQLRSTRPPTPTRPSESEVLTGKFLAEFCKRDEVVIATKLFFPVSMTEARFAAGATSQVPPNTQGLSRKRIFHAVDASLKRLNTDYIDLYQIHRWDARTPIEETMEALHDVVKAGKARYIGGSSMRAWQFAKAQQVAKEISQESPGPSSAPASCPSWTTRQPPSSCACRQTNSRRWAKATSRTR